MAGFSLYLKEYIATLRRVFTILFIITPAAVFPQQPSGIDSLRAAYLSATSDSSKVANLLKQADILVYESTEAAQHVIDKAIRLSKESTVKDLLVLSYNMQANLYSLTDRYEDCIRQYKASLQLAKKIQDEYGTSQALVGLGNVYYVKGDYATAKDYHLQNIAFCKKIDDLDGVASSYNNLGNIANDLGDYTNAIDYYTRASALYETIGSELPSAIVLGNIGMIQNKVKDYDKAIRYFEQSNVVFRKLNFKPGINFVLKNLGISYKNKGELNKALAVYREALDYYSSTDATRQQSEVLINIGNIYWEKKDYDQAQAEYFKALKLTTAVGDSVMIARAHNCIASTFFIRKDLVSAKEHFQKAIAIAHRLNNPLLLMTAEKDLHLVYAELNDFKDGYKTYDDYITIRDSLQGIEKSNAAKEIEAKYQSERKEKEIALLSAQNEMKAIQIKKRENERIYLFSVALIIAMLGLVMYRLYAIKKKANRNLQRVNQLQSNFFTNVSHEFRTPLTLILAALKKKQANGIADNYDNDVIERSTKRMLQLINQLLDLSKLEAGREKLQVRPTNVRDFLRTLTGSFTSLADERGIRFEINIPDVSLTGYLDTDKIEKIVFNLLSNAFKFTPSPGEVAFKSLITEKQLVMHVVDNGPGIPQESLQRIFQRFYQVNTADNRANEGTGIGLSLTKELVQLHRGTLSVTSEVNNGSTFTVTIPLRGYDQNAIVMDTLPARPEFAPAMFDLAVTGKKIIHYRTTNPDDFAILLVEDNPDLLNYLTESLKSDYAVLQASDGEEGYDMTLQHMPDLVITDLMMPKLDGREMCRKIRSNEKTSHIPLIMLTAKANRDSKLHGLETGADDYLTKPFDAAELALKIRNIRQQRERLQEHIRNELLFPEAKGSSNDKFLKKATDVVYANLTNTGFSIEDFQREMGYSRMQLHRKIKSITGQSANEFIRLIRLKKAALMLKNGHDQIAQIAYDTGFSSPSYFTKCFREVYGLTPSEYLENKIMENSKQAKS